MNSELRIIFIGFPSAGKSSFLGALWHVVEQGDVDDSMLLVTTVGDNEYITSLRSSWLACEPMGRTNKNSSREVMMTLRNRNDIDPITLVFPDVAGELFDEHWRYRVWSKEYLETIKELQGIVVFINADHVQTPELIAEYHTLLANIEADQISDDKTDILPYDPDKACQQAKVVDVLQQHLQYADEYTTIPIVVIISAWDVVDEQDDHGNTISPNEFLMRRVPLLWQFIKSNAERIPSKVYGISALGGNLDQDSDRLLAIAKPSERIIVVDGDNAPTKSNDITLPIKWMLDYLTQKV